ncbi:MAG: hypothetical protein IPO15_24025 [Anaerolineae bacterium]|uniref:hypothetical protein n=1 Tax=Candidatus Amarolinea dominans TaxID=3140696 RepID=UPI003136FA2E|nr:hypothetical protein [Anaerolineae bacterium]
MARAVGRVGPTTRPPARTSSIQARSAPNSVDILGASDLVHEYSGYSSGSWVYTAWQYVPTDYTGQSYFILLNTYVDVGTNNWSVQVQFDAGTNLVVNTGATGGTLPLIKGQWVELATRSTSMSIRSLSTTITSSSTPAPGRTK